MSRCPCCEHKAPDTLVWAVPGAMFVIVDCQVVWVRSRAQANILATLIEAGSGFVPIEEIASRAYTPKAKRNTVISDVGRLRTSCREQVGSDPVISNRKGYALAEHVVTKRKDRRYVEVLVPDFRRSAVERYTVPSSNCA